MPFFEGCPRKWSLNLEQKAQHAEQRNLKLCWYFRIGLVLVIRPESLCPFLFPSFIPSFLDKRCVTGM